MRSLLTAAALLLALSSPAVAAYDGHFGDMDTNSDSFVSWAEFHDRFPNATQSEFEGMDSNKDGRLDHDEWHVYKKTKGLQHKEADHGSKDKQ